MQRIVVESFLGIEIDHFDLVGYSGVNGVVDAVGGITVDSPNAFEIGGSYFEAGVIPLDGERALTFSRYRYGPDGDFGRINRPVLVIRALLHRLDDSRNDAPGDVIPEQLIA